LIKLHTSNANTNY